jgi:twitching motility two-component system response regulator PilH
LARKVLLADDSVTAQNMGRRILADAGYEVITVNNGSSALKKVTESKPDLIVLDVYMPGYGGLEVCQRIRESQETARIPVLLTVGKLEPFKAEEARRVRADAFIVKPFEASELLTALTKLEDKIVPQPSRKSSRSGKSFADEQPGVSREFGDVESGWKSRLKIPPPNLPRAHEAADSEDAAIRPGEASKSAETPVEIKPQDAAAGKELRETAEFAVPAEERTIGADETRAEMEPAASVEPVQAGHPEERKPHEDEVAAALASLAPANGHGADSAEAEAVPVTMAAAAAGYEFSGPRWIAQEVALAGDESSLILEQEMQKAFAAFAAADAARINPFFPREDSRPEISQSAPVDTALPESSDHSQPVQEEAVSAVAVSENQESTPSAVVDAVPPLETSESGVQQTNEGAAYAAAASAGTGAEPAGMTAEAVSHSVVTPEAPTPGESGHDSELAAAWANWKQLRESISAPESVSQMADTAATAVQAPRQEESPTNQEPETPADHADDHIAGIVDSVLAELKPKLMEQIARKMKKDK